MVSTHLFQVMTFLAMEPPVSFEPDRLRDETVKVLRSAETCDPDRVVRGQYRGYRDEQDVADRSETSRRSARSASHIDNWRWADVPFYLRTGKWLTSEAERDHAEVPQGAVQRVPTERATTSAAKRDHLTIRIQPDEGITLAVNAKKPGPGMHLGRVTMDFDYEEEFAQSGSLDAYELLLLEAMEGDHTAVHPSGRRRARVGDPRTRCSATRHPLHPYDRGSWGPAEAEALIHPRRWHMTALEDAGDHHAAPRSRARAAALVTSGDAGRVAEIVVRRIAEGDLETLNRALPLWNAGEYARRLRAQDRLQMVQAIAWRGRASGRPRHGAVPRARGVLGVGRARAMRRGPRRLGARGLPPPRRGDGADASARGRGARRRRTPGSGSR